MSTCYNLYLRFQVFCESLPILELIEETYPNEPRLLPQDPAQRHR